MIALFDPDPQLAPPLSRPADSVRRAAIVSCAQAIFLRYGLARTTMGDIAQAAAISRPSLYLHFSSKQEIFDTVVLKMATDHLDEIRGHLGNYPSASAKIEFLCMTIGLNDFEILRANPNAHELYDLEIASVRASLDMTRESLSVILQKHIPQAGNSRQLADIIIYSVRSFKSCTKDQT